LLIDCDAKKPAKIGDESSAAYGSTDAEHAAAKEWCVKIMHYLKDCGFPLPIFGDSGNGAHQLYRIDLPNDDTSTNLVREFLQALRRKFPDANIDEKVFNASRISKIYGTWVRKKFAPDRPNRLSKLETEPPKECFTPVPVELLRKVIADNAPPTAVQPSRPSASDAEIGESVDWIDKFIVANKIVITERRINDSGTWRCRWKLDTCPFCNLSDQSAVITVSASGAKGFVCQHNRCKGNDWHKFRRLFEPQEKKSRHETLADQFVERGKVTGKPVVCNNGVFYQFTGTHYARIEDMDVAVRQWMREVGESQNNNLVANVIPVIKAATYRQDIMPCWIGADPPPFSNSNDIVAFGNGLYDLSTGTLYPHSTDWLSTYCLSFNFDPSATCPQWIKFLNSSLEEDRDSISLLQEWFGYCLTETPVYTRH
jgi:hypothetical protein